jgi:hypothetical protein
MSELDKEKHKELRDSIDVVMQKTRKLQEQIFDFKQTPNDLFKFTADIIKSIEVVSQEIRKQE